MIRLIKGDITKIDDVDAIVNAAKDFIEENPDAFDLVEWALFDDRTYGAYEKELLVSK